MSLSHRFWWLPCLLLVGCQSKPPKQAPKPPLVFNAPVSNGKASAEAIEAGKAFVAQFQCNRCHDGTGLETPPREKHCVNCHRDIFSGAYKEDERLLKKWRGHIKHLTITPSLGQMSGRFQPEWLTQFLQNPHDLRPRLGAQMPRLAINAKQASAMTAYLMPDLYAKQTLPKGGDLKRGKALMETKGCMTCHNMTGQPDLKPSSIPVEVPATQLVRAMKLAPDLSHTRERFQPAGVVAWLLDPQKMSASASMPNLKLTTQEAVDLATFLLNAPLQPTAAKPIPKRLPVLTRPVKYEEVEKKVFRFICWHCHSEGDYVNGDGGPGNTGGFGFKPRKLSLASYTAISRGLLDHQGERMSVFSKDEKTQTPLLIRAMMARHHEVAGQPVKGIRGMPLGLPPMSLEKIQLVESWIAQGRPR